MYMKYEIIEQYGNESTKVASEYDVEKKITFADVKAQFNKHCGAIVLSVYFI